MSAIAEQVKRQKGSGLIQASSLKPFRTPVTEKGQPYLVLGNTSSYSWIYNDAGSGADMDVTLWRPVPAGGVFIIGDYAQGNYGDPSGTTLTVRSVNDPDNTLLKPPIDYRLIWNDKGSGGDNDGSVWFPVPPDNFVSIGAVGQIGYDKPSISSYRCVHSSVLQTSSAGVLIWSDGGSHADMDVSLYPVLNDPGIFVAQADYDPYSGTTYQFKTT
jgi:hypothetical protein